MKTSHNKNNPTYLKLITALKKQLGSESTKIDIKKKWLILEYISAVKDNNKVVFS
jgi:hypothetical protein